ncbi:hypothetical protein LA080_006036 [Diaporthe eres]|nr:hypothetical protein LA080_006036 [Diaporthe eres]
MMRETINSALLEEQKRSKKRPSYIANLGAGRGQSKMARIGDSNAVACQQDALSLPGELDMPGQSAPQQDALPLLGEPPTPGTALDLYADRYARVHNHLNIPQPPINFTNNFESFNGVISNDRHVNQSLHLQPY